jgi:hypothetical protein
MSELLKRRRTSFGLVTMILAAMFALVWFSGEEVLWWSVRQNVDLQVMNGQVSWVRTHGKDFHERTKRSASPLMTTSFSDVSATAPIIQVHATSDQRTAPVPIGIDLDMSVISERTQDWFGVSFIEAEMADFRTTTVSASLGFVVIPLTLLAVALLIKTPSNRRKVEIGMPPVTC